MKPSEFLEQECPHVPRESGPGKTVYYASGCCDCIAELDAEMNRLSADVERLTAESSRWRKSLRALESVVCAFPGDHGFFGRKFAIEGGEPVMEVSTHRVGDLVNRLKYMEAKLAEAQGKGWCDDHQTFDRCIYAKLDNERVLHERAKDDRDRLCRPHESVYKLLVEHFGDLRGDQQTLHHRLSSIVSVAEMRALKAEAKLAEAQAQIGDLAGRGEADCIALRERAEAAEARVKQLEESEADACCDWLDGKTATEHRECANAIVSGLRAQNGRLRQRVEELERLNRYNVAQAKADAEAAEAKLAEVDHEAGILTQGITDQHDRAARAEAEIERLEGLILDCAVSDGVPLSVDAEARRIRAQREDK